MKYENSFFEVIFKKTNIKKIETLKKIIKDYMWITPIIYIIGTVALLIRNKMLGLQFVPISLLQFSLIAIYLLIFLFIYSLIEYNTICTIDYIKNKQGRKSKSIIGIISMFFVYFIMTFSILYLLTNDFKISVKILTTFFIFWPVIVIIINNPDIMMSRIITIVMFMTLVLYIPISLGGLKGQKVIYNDYKNNEKYNYTYYGNYDNLYQFIDGDKVLLIPIDSGYIEYSK